VIECTEIEWFLVVSYDEIRNLSISIDLLVFEFEFDIRGGYPRMGLFCFN